MKRSSISLYFSFVGYTILEGLQPQQGQVKFLPCLYPQEQTPLVHHRLQARVQPFLPIHSNTKNSPPPVEIEICILPSCGQMLKHDKHGGLLRRRPASAVCLHLAEGPLGDVLQNAATQTSTGAWRQPHSARCCMK